jgi:O-antigen ligase/polysaccharide polymerase Wzy-like membrane protein
LFTYSRGALGAALVGLAVLALVAWRAGDRPAAAATGAAVAVGVALSAAFALGGEVFRLRLASEGTTAWYGARYTPVEPALRLRAGEERRTEVRVVNSGLKSWTAGEGFALSYHWFAPERSRVVDGVRTPLARPLAHGEGASLQAVVHAPAEPGCYLLVWDMVQEHTTWFSGQGVPPAAVPTVVGDADERECARGMPLPLRLGGQPPRRELWAAALAMWRDRPWTGVGPDNFRRLYGRYTGRTFWDERVAANNLVLETGATTGLLGVLALAGTLGAAGVSAGRLAAGAGSGSPRAVRGGLRHGAEAPADFGESALQQRVCAAAVLGLLAAVVTHGAVDYLLGFTGPYLLLAFVVGAATDLREPERAAWIAQERGAA